MIKIPTEFQYFLNNSIGVMVDFCDMSNEMLRYLISRCASSHGKLRIMHMDVRRAYFYASATRDLFIEIPSEDWEEGDEMRV